MLSLEDIPEVDAQEGLSRFVYSSGHIRRSNQTLKPNAFLPDPHDNLSVTRDREATDDELWTVGRTIADDRSRAESRTVTLHGRGDVLANTYRAAGLTVEPDPVADNPNHTLIKGWDMSEKAKRLQRCQEIAEKTTFKPTPAV